MGKKIRDKQIRIDEMKWEGKQVIKQVRTDIQKYYKGKENA